MFDRPVVDSVVFARDEAELRGEAAVSGMPRLRDMLADDRSSIVYCLAGFMGEQERPSLRLQVSAELRLTCQRCLGAIEFKLGSGRTFELIAPGVPLGDPADEAEDVEEIHADPRLDVLTLVEDEVILSLPMVVVHEDGQCTTVAGPDAAGAGQKSPFSALSALKRQ